MENEYFASINEVSKRLDVPAHTLRYWEKQFPTAIRPTTGAGGRRYYRAETVKRLTMIRELLYTRGMTIAGVKKMLRDGEFTNLDLNTPVVAAPVDNNVVSSVDGNAIDSAIETLVRARQILGV